LNIPWWVCLYWLIFILFSISWVWDAVKTRKPWRKLAADSASETCMALMGLAYWFETLQLVHGRVALCLWVCSVAWYLIVGIREVREYLHDPKYTPGVNSFLAVVGVLTALTLYWPMLYWGFRYAALGLKHPV
jgi:hypothetical protein